MKKYVVLTAILIAAFQVQAGTMKFDFTKGKQVKGGPEKITQASVYTPEVGYGYDLLPAPKENSNEPFFFSVAVPDGNYRVTVQIGSKKKAGVTTLKGECRRLFIDNLKTKKGEIVTKSFIVNKRDSKIDEKENVGLKDRERGSLTWDEKLTLEINGSAPVIESITIEPANVPTVYLCGNSTVVDQRNEPWASWGQMIPVFFNDQVAISNHAESGLAARSFLGSRRLKKILTTLKPGDFVFVEFGHNDSKEKGAGAGAYFSYMYNLKIFVDEVRAKGATPVLVTPTQRRQFDDNAKIRNTHGEYPDAMKFLAQKENVALIDLNAMTKTLFEAMGVEPSKNALVHYPAHTFPGQEKPLADNTHFNPYGAYEVAKCVMEGIRQSDLSLKSYIREGYAPFNPAQPDAFETYHWDPSPFSEIEKPDGN